MLRELFDLLEFGDYVFGEHALAEAGYVWGDGLRSAGEFVGFALDLGEIYVAA